MVGFVVWLTGLSGAGKSTLASLLTQELAEQGVHVECLDGDEVRKNLSHGLGFAREDRDRNVRRIGYVARMVARSGACAITAAISPYEALRDEIRRKTENFVEVYCECPLDVLTARDPKGLYKRALAGEIKNFTGVDDPYEAPQQPEVHLRTDRMTPEECVGQILSHLREKGLLRLGHNGGALLPAPFGGEVFEARRLAAQDERLPRIQVDSSLRDEVRFVAAGFVSPLCGFMTEREAIKVTRGSALERGTPWWDRPFLLPVSGADVETLGLAEAKHDPVAALLACGDEVVARVTIEDVWGDHPTNYAAGSLDAVAELTTTARQLRRRTMATPAGHAVALYSTGPPSADAKTALSGALSAVDHVALLVTPSHSKAWQAASAGCTGLSLVEVPSAIPLDSERARNVIAKSIGALKVGELRA